MSDVSVLSHEYKTASELSQAINTNLIVLKRVALGLPGAEKVNAAQFMASCYRLAEIVETLVNLLLGLKSVWAARAARLPILKSRPQSVRGS